MSVKQSRQEGDQAGVLTEAACIPERDVWMAAGLMIKQYGEQAVIEASKKADQFLKSGDMDGQRIWIRIVRAVAAMMETDSRAAH